VLADEKLPGDFPNERRRPGAARARAGVSVRVPRPRDPIGRAG
jgi:hypothetical protein